jgi:endonuclease/exonuclease/phosphatase (EEP) superfamily protein YafD
VALTDDTTRSAHRRRRVVAARILAGTLLTVTLAAFAGRWSWPAEVAASFRPHLAALCLLGALLALLLRRPLPAVLLLAAVALNVLPVLPLVRGDPAPAAEGAPTITVAHQNAQGGAGGSVEVLQHLDEHPVDVLVLLAPAPDWTVYLRPTAPQLGYQVVYPTTGEADEGVIVLSRVPVTEARIATAPGLPAESVEVTVALGDRPLHLLAAHTQNPLTPGRWVRRNDQLEAIARWVHQQDGDVALLGDLNLAAWSPTFRWFEGETGLTSSSDGAGIQVSWPYRSALGRRLGVPIDQLLHSEGLTTVDRRITPTIGSEHGVLQVTLAPAAR